MEKEIEIFVEAAEQLQALKSTLVEQHGASVRLRSLTDALERIVTQIAKVPVSLSAIVEKSKAVEQQILAAANKVELLKDEIPALIERIEQSDMGKSIEALTAQISGSRGDLNAFHESILHIENVVQQFRSANVDIGKEITAEIKKSEANQEKVSTYVHALQTELIAKLDVLEKRVISTENLSEKSISATGKAYEVVVTVLKGSSERQFTALQDFQSQIERLKSDEMAGIRQDMKTMLAQLQRQGAAIEALAKKKGFSF